MPGYFDDGRKDLALTRTANVQLYVRQAG